MVNYSMDPEPFISAGYCVQADIIPIHLTMPHTPTPHTCTFRFFHAMMHHSLGDHEDEHHRFECTSCLGLPRLWRLPVICFGHIFQFFITSNKKLLTKGPLILSKPLPRQALGPYLFFTCVARTVMSTEFFVCIMTGQILPWLLQVGQGMPMGVGPLPRGYSIFKS
jgi:hypothetical protein